MASLSINKEGNAKIQFSGFDGCKKTIYLARLPKKNVDQIKSRVENIISAKLSGMAIDSATAAWLGELPEPIYSKLANVGLVAPRETVIIPSLGEWVNKYLATRCDVKPSTIRNYKATIANLLGFFTKDRRLDTISIGDAEDFRRWMESRYKLATVNRRCKRARQFFTAAIKKEIIRKNPFDGMSCGNQTDRERMYYVKVEDIYRIIEACPNHEWRLIFALARFTGLRVPSELVLLKWSDIDWEKKRILIHSPKTAKQGKPTRVIPLFPELYPYLLDSFTKAEDGQEYVVGHYSSRTLSKAALRTQAVRIIRRAGLEPWPKLFTNCRSSCIIDLSHKFPIHVATAWMGHSPKTAMTHYLAVLESDFEKALKVEKHDANSDAFTGKTTSGMTRNPTQNLAAMSGIEKKESYFGLENIGGNASHCDLVNAVASGCEQEPNSPGRTRTFNPAVNSRMLYH